MEARCQCGQLTASISGEGAGVMCHCKSCQRRSGSPFGMMVYYLTDLVSISGDSTQYTRQADSGNEVTNGFCPICGTPFWLTTARHPGAIGIAAGAIEDFSSEPPVRSVFENNKHSWVVIPDTTQGFPRGRDS